MKKDKTKKTEAPIDTEPTQEEQTQGSDKQPEMVSVDRQKLEEASRQFDEAQKQRDEYLDMARRVQAEFENYKRRNASLRTEVEDETLVKTIKEILPSLDNLERALDAAKEDSPLKEGVSMTLRGLNDALAKLGLESVPCKVGEPFDPELHDAVMTCETSGDLKPGDVAEIFQKGYSVRGKIVRHCMVTVAQ